MEGGVPLEEKYVLLKDDTIKTADGRTLFRIQKVGDPMEIAMLDDSGEKIVIAPGDLGGYIGGYDNLSQYCNSWIMGGEKPGVGGKVYGSARVERDAVISEDSTAYGEDIVIEEMKFGDMVIPKKVITSVVISGNTVIKKSDIVGPCSISALDSTIEDTRIKGSSSDKYSHFEFSPEFDEVSGKVIKNYSPNWTPNKGYQELRQEIHNKSYGVQIVGERINIKHARIKDGVVINGHNIDVSSCTIGGNIEIRANDITVSSRGVYTVRRRLDMSNS